MKTQPSPMTTLAERIQWILRHRREFRSITDLSLKSGLARSTLTNQLRAAEESGVEPILSSRSYHVVAGNARVSLSWLQLGGALHPDGPDIPPAPEVEPLEIARRRRGTRDAELEELRMRVAKLERLLGLPDRRPR